MIGFKLLQGVTERSVEVLRLTAEKCKRGKIFAPKISLLQHAFCCVLRFLLAGRYSCVRKMNVQKLRNVDGLFEIFVAVGGKESA